MTLVKNYGVSLYIINSNFWSSMVVFIVLNFPTIYIIDNWGLRAGISLGAFFTCLGLWIRCLVNENFYYAVIGQAVAAAGQPFFFNSITLLSQSWFPRSERIISTSVGSNAETFGMIIGSFMPTLFFTASEATNVAAT